MTGLPSVDPFLWREYKRVKYTCIHFARDVWLELTGVDMFSRIGMREMSAWVREEQRASLGVLFERLDGPRDPCIVLMMRANLSPHIGVLVRGRLLHLTPSGAEHIPLELATMGFTDVRFYQ